MLDIAPRNELESLILEMHAGGIAPEDFVARLLELQVFMPVKDDRHGIAGFQSTTKAEPLVVEDEEGNRVLVLFSAPDRAREFLLAYPGYAGGMLTEFSWVLQRMAADVGISINPGLEPGFDFDPEMVAMAAALLPDAEQ